MSVLSGNESRPIYINIRGLGTEESPYFVLYSDKEEVNKYYKLEGYIVDAYLGSYTFKEKGSGKEKQRETINLVIAPKSEDDFEKYTLSMSFTGLSRNIINCLSSVDGKPLGLISIGLYYKDGRQKVSVRSEGQILSWKHSGEEINKLRSPKINPDTQEIEGYSYVKVDELFKQEIIKLKEKVQNDLPGFIGGSDEQEAKDHLSDNDDDLPF